MAAPSRSEVASDPRWAPLVPRPFRVAAVREELGDTWTLELEPPDGRFAFAPGQFNMLYAFGRGESAISISGDPLRPGALVHTIRAVGAVTRGLCALGPGDTVGVRGPFGAPWPVEGAAGRDLVIVAGGIGLAPLRPVIYQALGQRERFGRVALLYGSRTPGDLLYGQQLLRWLGGEELEVHVTVDAAGPSWPGNVGVVTTLIPRLGFDPAGAVVMVCGPEVMMRFTAQAFFERGVDPGDLFLSMERNMKCAVGHCGRCQLGPGFVCKDGPVYPWTTLGRLMTIREL